MTTQSLTERIITLRDFRPSTTLTSTSGQVAHVDIDAEGYLIGVPDGCPIEKVWPDGFAHALALRSAIVDRDKQAERDQEIAELRESLREEPIAYRVCTFGSPSYIVAESEAGLDYPAGRGTYADHRTASRVADGCVGTGSCTNARVAVVYTAEADPDISLGSGKGWEWASYRVAREERLAMLLGKEAR